MGVMKFMAADLLVVSICAGVPLPAWMVVLAIGYAGHRMIVEGADIVITPGVGLDVHLLAELKRWKPHAIMLLGYTADDSHLRTVVGSGTTGAAS